MAMVLAADAIEASRAWGLGSGDKGLGFRISGFGFRV